MGTCNACKVKEDCGKCNNCKDKKKFGGEGKQRQACVYKKAAAHTCNKYSKESFVNKTKAAGTKAGKNKRKRYAALSDVSTSKEQEEPHFVKPIFNNHKVSRTG